MNESELFKLNDTSFIRKLIKNSTAQFSLVYKATQDGFNAASFYKNVDQIDKILILIKNEMDIIFGGFTNTQY